MEPARAAILSQIDQAIQAVENAKQAQQRILAAFLEHVPAADPQIVEKRIQDIRDTIHSLEEQREALLREQQFHIVNAASSIRGGQGD